MSPVPVLSPDELAKGMSHLPAWSVVDGKLHRELEFDNFRAAFAFMTAVALEAERLDHHPDWSNSWNRVVVDIVSHAAGGITEGCLRLATAAEEHARRFQA